MLTKSQMKAKLLLWIQGLIDEDLKVLKDCGLSKKYARDYSTYKIQDVKNTAGVPAFEFRFDADLYEIINGYRNDGFMAKTGATFEEITDGTGWVHEPIEASVEYFIKDM